MMDQYKMIHTLLNEAVSKYLNNFRCEIIKLFLVICLEIKIHQKLLFYAD